MKGANRGISGQEGTEFRQLVEHIFPLGNWSLPILRV